MKKEPCVFRFHGMGRKPSSRKVARGRARQPQRALRRPGVQRGGPATADESEGCFDSAIERAMPDWRERKDELQRCAARYLRFDG